MQTPKKIYVFPMKRYTRGDGVSKQDKNTIFIDEKIYSVNRLKKQGENKQKWNYPLSSMAKPKEKNSVLSTK